MSPAKLAHEGAQKHEGVLDIARRLNLGKPTPDTASLVKVELDATTCLAKPSPPDRLALIEDQRHRAVLRLLVQGIEL